MEEAIEFLSTLKEVIIKLFEYLLEAILISGLVNVFLMSVPGSKFEPKSFMLEVGLLMLIIAYTKYVMLRKYDESNSNN